nr:hypothetical protein [Tanacetum cinerariifolium]
MLLAKEKLIKAVRTCLKNNNQPLEEKSIAILLAEESILTVIQTLEEKQIDKETSHLLSDDDDDFYRESIDETPSSDAIAPDLPITDTLVMDNEHLDTIPETDLDEEIESSVKNLNLTPSESEDLFDYEFFGELAHTDLIPSGINEANFDPKEDIHLVERLLYDSDSDGDIFFYKDCFTMILFPFRTFLTSQMSSEFFFPSSPNFFNSSLLWE